MTTITAGPGSNRGSGSTSGAAILAAFIPALIIAVVYLAVFIVIRNANRKFYAPRTYLGTVPEKDRTPQSNTEGASWLWDYWSLSDIFVLQHNSLDAYLFLRFLKFVIGICFVGCCMIWPVLLPINYTGGGTARQLDRLTFSNIDKNDRIWAHLVVSMGFFLVIIGAIAWERLRLIGIRQAYLLDEYRAARLSSRTVLFLNAPSRACQSENLEEYFGSEAERSWPVMDVGDLDDLVGKRNGAAYTLEKAQMDLIIAGAKHQQRQGGSTRNGNATNLEAGQALVPNHRRPSKRNPPLVGSKFDPVEKSRKKVGELAERIEVIRSAPGRNIPENSAVFVSFSSQAAAHRAFQQISFLPTLPVQDRFLAVQPKEVLWKNVALPVPVRLSKASLALVFVVAFTILFSIPIGLIGTFSNVKELANRYEWLSWVNNLPSWVLGLLVGFVPPYLVSWFTSYVPKLFRHIAKLSGEPTIPQAELKTQAWNFTFQVFQIFLVTTFASGAAAVVAKIAQDPRSAPDLFASSVPKASNFYLTYFILQGLGSAAQTIVRYSDLFEYYFYEFFWDKSPREKFTTYAQMKGTPWASWYPKFTNFLVIAIAYSCIAPLVLGFATAGIFLFYLSYRHQLLYVVQTKIDTKGEAYKRALQQMPTGLYLAQLSLIGLFGARKAAAQTTLMVLFLIFTAGVNFVLDRMLRPLELYLGVDVWQQQEPLLAEIDGVSQDDEAALHAASHARRLGLKRLPSPLPRLLSDFFDSIISSARSPAEAWLAASSSAHDDAEIQEDDLKKAYLQPTLTSKTPKLWIPRDRHGISQQEIELNEAAGIKTTDDGAEIDEHGGMHWDHRFENVPIWSPPKVV
ncbi:hypothetical protein BDY17DRAFT_253762 [Neohortaea acidophila]|uniref:DUF221-domain-containing protein n=1 Tax=Neohortaea acidophila TaxID=245834 RepID=A0A6A6PNM1_9PEZI|nr:uncharacterized protein BDY17DRAFT_253762 [Neohortaea acidophila]KAF2481033.1 hypothetical protein BDY17DRAFT_253762 [Neohortaea acidophila]